MLRFDERGLVPAIAQDRLTGQVRMLAWTNAAALEHTLRTGLATFYSRSRSSLWTKGETSGNHLRVHSLYVDCDEDTILMLVDPAGPSCHTGRPSCFFRRMTATGVEDEEHDAAAFIELLEAELATRKNAPSSGSYTRSLLDGGAKRIGEKLLEEADELRAALEGETNERVAAEAADLVYHLLVGLQLRDVPWRSVIEVLAERFGVSGHDEKRSRASPAVDG